MTTSRASQADRVRAAGFSLPELVIGSSLSTIVLAGVLAAFLLLARSGIDASNYSTAESEIRRAVEAFSQDVRMASDLTWNSPTSITLTLPAPSLYSNLFAAPANPNNHKVTYTCDLASGRFIRQPGLASSGLTPLLLVRNVSNFNFVCYNRLSETPLDPAAANFSSQVKRVQISLNVRVASATGAATNTTLAMASTILRNKLAN